MKMNIKSQPRASERGQAGSQPRLCRGDFGRPGYPCRSLFSLSLRPSRMVFTQAVEWDVNSVCCSDISSPRLAVFNHGLSVSQPQNAFRLARPGIIFNDSVLQ